MNIQDFLSPADVLVDMRAKDKPGVLKQLAGHAAAALGLPADVAVEQIQKRDDLGSTGIGGGVALPHARFREVGKPFGVLARLRQPIDFDAVDGQPVDLVLLILLPASPQLDQLNALAAAARKLRDGDVLRHLRTAATPLEVFEAITRA